MLVRQSVNHSVNLPKINTDFYVSKLQQSLFIELQNTWSNFKPNSLFSRRIRPLLRIKLHEMHQLLHQKRLILPRNRVQNVPDPTHLDHWSLGNEFPLFFFTASSWRSWSSVSGTAICSTTSTTGAAPAWRPPRSASCSSSNSWSMRMRRNAAQLINAHAQKCRNLSPVVTADHQCASAEMPHFSPVVTADQCVCAEMPQLVSSSNIWSMPQKCRNLFFQVSVCRE